MQLYTWRQRDPAGIFATIRDGNELLDGVMGSQTRSMAELMPAAPQPPTSLYNGLVGEFFSR
jgi:hypothetical protein